MQVSFQVPDAIVAGGSYVTDNLVVISTLIGAAVLASIATEVYKRRYYKKNDIKLAKKWIATWLTVTSIFFTYLGHLLVLASAGAGYFSGLPFVGEHFAAVVGIGYAIYAFRLNKFYQGASAWLGKWSKSNDDKAPESPIGNIAVVTAPIDEREFSLPE